MKKIFLDNIWENKLKGEFEKEYMKNLSEFLNKEKLTKTIYPLGSEIFNAFNLTCFRDVKVIILGQDPYHGFGQAHGLSFSVKHGVKPPPSLQNIFKELETDIGISKPNHGNLEKWSKQGVFLLNSILTVEKNNPGSHSNKGWEKFTDKVLKELSSLKKNLVYILWGKKAQEKGNFINKYDNLIIQSSHPSPYSANNGFFGSKPFSRTNEYLIKYKIDPIKWNLNG